MGKKNSDAVFFRAGCIAAAVAGSVLCAKASASAVPTWTNGEMGVFTHTAGTGATNAVDGPLAMNISSGTPVLLFNHFGFAPGLSNTNASAGLQHQESSTSTKIIIASGTGVSQTDASSVETPSSVEVLYNAVWTLNNGSFGAPLSGSFSLPIGAKIGAGGSASATVKVDWYYKQGAGPLTTLCGEYNMTHTWTGAQNVLTSFTAPTVLLSPSTIPQDDLVQLSADIIFTADADDPTLIEVPTAADFSDMGVTTDQVGTMSIDVVVPEPSSLLMISAGASALLMRRRRRL